MTVARAQFNELLKKHEGLSFTVYKDSEGIETIGYGWNLREPMPIEIIDALRDHKVNGAYADLDALVPKWDLLSDQRQLVLMSMAYQLGRARLAGFKKFLMHVRTICNLTATVHPNSVPMIEQEIELAASEMLHSKWALQTPSRVADLVGMWRDG